MNRRKFCRKVRETEREVYRLEQEGDWRGSSWLRFQLRNCWWGHRRYENRESMRGFQQRAKQVNYEEWLEWREKYFEEGLNLLNKEELTEEQQMEAWEKSLKEADSGHRPS